MGGAVSEGKVDVGKEVSLRAPEDVNIPEKVALFMPSPDAGSALVLYTEGKVAITIFLYTEGKVAITIDRDIGSGAKVR